MEPSELQYSIISALETLELLQNSFYDEGSGNWYINTSSVVLPIAIILQNGDVVPLDWGL
ncbi:hypothetical protein NIES4071_55110 [Calothrix sp. NIES-4071]|nr:hypothetical protein NIES4071_55110 [Calothrix sp. NIES-4071]BAZ59818.1 hypothetical protein NIES4105_55060 [Calothrix sp. NIES-4105]